MRLLVAIKSCVRDKNAGCHQALRDTWGKNLPAGVDLLFFMGGEKAPADLLEDERYLSVADGYWESTPKMLGIVKYAVQMDYDFSLLCDTDTYLDLPGLMRSGFENYDYSGVLSGGRRTGDNPTVWTFGTPYAAKVSDHDKILINPSYAYMSGGHGYIISRLAAKIVATLNTPIKEGEDIMVGHILGPFFKTGELKAAVLPNYENVVAFHLGCGYYGGNHKLERTDPVVAIREKHKEFEGK